MRGAKGSPTKTIMWLRGGLSADTSYTGSSKMSRMRAAEWGSGDVVPGSGRH